MQSSHASCLFDVHTACSLFCRQLVMSFTFDTYTYVHAAMRDGRLQAGPGWARLQ